MRLGDRNEGSIKALLIFALLIGNILVALLRQGTASSPGAHGGNARFTGRLHQAASFAEPLTP